MKILSIFPFLFLLASNAAADPISNPQIDSKGYLADVSKAHALREGRLVLEERFLEMANDENTIILDARSADGFAKMHIAGSKNLPFTEFSETSLKTAIPSKGTRILIYCNNNIKNSPDAYFGKAARAALNLSTFPSLYTYGYRNVYELGPQIDPATSKIKFEGTLAPKG